MARIISKRALTAVTKLLAVLQQFMIRTIERLRPVAERQKRGLDELIVQNGQTAEQYGGMGTLIPGEFLGPGVVPLGGSGIQSQASALRPLEGLDPGLYIVKPHDLVVVRRPRLTVMPHFHSRPFGRRAKTRSRQGP